MENNARPFRFRSVAIAALLAGVASAAAVLGLYGIASVLGIDFVGQMGPSAPAAPIPLPSFVVASFIPALLAAGVLLALNALTKKPAQIFAATSAVLALVSLVGPATLAGASGGTRATLGLMHLVAAGVICFVLLRRGRSAAQPDGHPIGAGHE
jgi:Family of unknown function (DUF6069)